MGCGGASQRPKKLNQRESIYWKPESDDNDGDVWVHCSVCYHVSGSASAADDSRRVKPETLLAAVNALVIFHPGTITTAQEAWQDI